MTSAPTDEPTDVFMVKFRCVPSAANPQLSQFGGATVVCWATADDVEEAVALSMAFLKEDGWEVTEELEAGPSSREDQSEKGLPFYERAASLGFDYVAVTWPREDAEV